MQEQLLLLNENKDIIKGKCWVGITSKTKYFFKSTLSSNVSKMFMFRGRLPANAILGKWFGLSDLGVLFTTPNVSQI